jgi:hypothetical protein
MNSIVRSFPSSFVLICVVFYIRTQRKIVAARLSQIVCLSIPLDAAADIMTRRYARCRIDNKSAPPPPREKIIIRRHARNPTTTPETKYT